MFKYDFIPEQKVAERKCAYTRIELMDYKLASDTATDREYKTRTVYVRGTYEPVGKGIVELLGLKGKFIINPNEIVSYEQFNVKAKEIPQDSND